MFGNLTTLYAPGIIALPPTSISSYTRWHKGGNWNGGVGSDGYFDFSLFKIYGAGAYQNQLNQPNAVIYTQNGHDIFESTGVGNIYNLNTSNTTNYFWGMGFNQWYMILVAMGIGTLYEGNAFTNYPNTYYRLSTDNNNIYLIKNLSTGQNYNITIPNNNIQNTPRIMLIRYDTISGINYLQIDGKKYILNADTGGATLTMPLLNNFLDCGFSCEINKTTYNSTINYASNSKIIDISTYDNTATIEDLNAVNLWLATRYNLPFNEFI